VTVSKIPFPPPDWINTNATWAAEQLALYLENRTGEISAIAKKSQHNLTTTKVR
jgi:hypothetical protein